MSEIQVSNQPTAELLLPHEIEARLNALIGPGSGSDSSEADCEKELDALDQFLADPAQQFFATRTSEQDDHGNEFDTAVEYHRLKVAPDQTRFVLHLKFQPDFIRPPDIELNLIDADGRVRLTHNYIFGARAEITLSSSSELETTVCLEAICTTQTQGH